MNADKKYPLTAAGSGIDPITDEDRMAFDQVPAADAVDPGVIRMNGDGALCDNVSKNEDINSIVASHRIRIDRPPDAGDKAESGTKNSPGEEGRINYDNKRVDVTLPTDRITPDGEFFQNGGGFPACKEHPFR